MKMMVPIGYYSQPVTGGSNPEVSKTPYYTKRRMLLKLINEYRIQIQIMWLGSLVWINVDPSQLSQVKPWN